MPEDLSVTIKKLREQDYVNLVGKEMDHLWKNCGDSQETIRTQQETAEFIRIKE